MPGQPWRVKCRTGRMKSFHASGTLLGNMGLFTRTSHRLLAQFASRRVAGQEMARFASGPGGRPARNITTEDVKTVVALAVFATPFYVMYKYTYRRSWW